MTAHSEQKTARPELDEFSQAYVQCALWLSTDDDDQPLDARYSVDDIADETLQSMALDCERFQRENEADISTGQSRCGSSSSALAGHNFWLTRNGHGAGFWDGDYPDEAGNRLTSASELFGSQDLYVGDDGKLYI